MFGTDSVFCSMACFLLVQYGYESIEVRRLESFCKALAPGVVAFVKANTVFYDFKYLRFGIPARKLPGQAGVPSQLDEFRGFY